MTLSLHHVAINCVAPEQTAAFYREAVGFQVIPVGDGEPLWLAAPNAYLALFEASGGAAPSDRQVCDAGIGHFCLQSGDGNGLWQKLADRGMRFNDKPVALGTGAIYAYGRDPDHNLVEVEGVNAAPSDPLTWIAHLALVTPDIERLSDFYARLLEQDTPRSGCFANSLFENITGLADVDVSARWIDTDNLLVEIWQYHNPPTGPAQTTSDGMAGYRHAGFCCEMLEGETVRLASVGIVTQPCSDIGGYRTVQGRDPDGNRFVIMEIGAGPSPLSLCRLADPSIVTRRAGKI